MNRISSAFENGHKAFIGFLVGGDPTPEISLDYFRTLIRNGVDLIEIGIPFSDPIADGPVIQRANARSLSHGTTVETIFQLVRDLRKESEVPIVLLTSLNPILNYGYLPFFEEARRSGVDGMIVPDLPLEEREELAPFAAKTGLSLINMIAPTSGERIRQLASTADGFIYVVSSTGVTGQRNEIKTDLSRLLGEIRQVTDLPAAIGFGIHTPDQVEEMSKVADGVIVGSGMVQLIERYGENAAEPLAEYVRSLTAPLSD